MLMSLWMTAGCGSFFVYPGSTSGGGGSTGSGGNYVYVANATIQSLAGFAVGTGTLTAVTGSPYTLGFTPTAVAINPANSFLFVSGYNNAGTGLIYGYSIGATGALSALNNGLALVTGYEEVAMDISPDGQWLMGLDGVVTTTSGTLDEFSINASTGTLTGPTPAPFTVSNTGAVVPRAVKFSPGGTLVFVALGTAGDLVYTFNTSAGSGALASSQSLSFTTATSDNGLAVSPSGSYLYVARSGIGGGLVAYTITGSGGALIPVSGSPYAAGAQPYSVAVNLTSADVYVASRSDGKIYGYSVGSTGALTALNAAPYTSGTFVTAISMDKSGSYLAAAANGGSPDLTLYSFDTSANLVTATSTATGTDPTGPVAIATTH
jgi:6-phosphogluconolactonase (cycloisomerase 2 family)